MAINIVVLDCQKMFVEGLEAHLHFSSKKYKIAKQICTSTELLDTMIEEEYDVLITELNIPDRDGIEIIEEIRERYPEIKILVLSAFMDSKLVRKAMVKGADGYVSKHSSMSELTYALDEIIKGDVFLGEGLSMIPTAYTKSSKSNKTPSKYQDKFTIQQNLTKREKEILKKITQGKNNKCIGSELFISDQTVGVHRKNIMKKLRIQKSSELIKFAIANELV